MERSFISIAIVGILLSSWLALCTAQNFGKPCEGYKQSEIYCYGDFLYTVQRAKFYKDQKTFVDRPLKREPEQVLADFKALNIVGENLNETAKNILSEFIEANFDKNGTEFEPWDPSDWVANPSFLAGIKDIHLRNWASEIHHFWKELGRKIRDDVKENSTRHSMYYVSHPVIVPGGRFKEFYYWDSYWIQRGLLVSNMTQTVKGMIENFFEMVKLLGFIPNGGRIYYQRSQPPLLLPMVDSYYEATKDVAFLRDNIDLMIQEFDFFLDKRTVPVEVTRSDGKKVSHIMARYNVELTDPRPESFSEDYELINSANLTPEEKEIMYGNLKSGAESGWDFSSRWFVMPGDESLIDGNLTHTKTRDIIPVDLNSFMYWNAKLLEKFCALIGNAKDCPADYGNIATQWQNAIKDVLWDEEMGTWFDYNHVTQKRRRYFFPTNLSPLWVQAHHGDLKVIAKRAVNYLHASGAVNFPGGIPTSMLQTGQQWDFPNGWAPLNHLVVEALENSQEKSAQDLAYELAKKWVQSNHLAYVQTEGMYEKYDVTIVGSAGSGGEYEVVVGFGWSNGVVLDFLRKYGDKLTPVENFPTTTPNPSHIVQSPRNKSGGERLNTAMPMVVVLSVITFVLKKL